MFSFVIAFFYFLLIITLLIFSGNLILKIIKLDFKNLLENFLFSLTFSLTLLTLLSYFALILNLSFLVVSIFWLFVVLGFFNLFNTVGQKKDAPQIKFDWGLVSLTLILTLLMVSVTARSGWQVKDGLEFFGVNAHDGLWHLSLIGELKNHFPPQHPNFSGIELKGYHYFLDLLLAKFSQVFGFSETDLYFRFFPVLTAVLWVLATFLLSQRYFQNRNTTYLTVFFSILGGGFAYLLPLFHGGEVNLDSGFGASAPISSLINLQFAFSIPVLALSFYTFTNFLKEKTFGWGLLTAIFIGSLFGLKIYAGVTVLFAVGLASLFYFFKTKNLKILWVSGLGWLLGLTVYLPTSIGGAGLVFAPGEMVQSIIRGPLSWTLWELQRQIYAQHYNFLGLTKIAIFAHLTFFFGNLGTKVLGLGEILKFRKSSILSENFGLFSWALTLTFSLPLFFIQSITPFNIVQFWWYFLYLMSFPAASFTWNFLKQKTMKVKLVSLATLFILTVPAAVFVLYGYLFPRTSYLIPRSKLVAIQFLKETTHPDDVILEIPENSETGNFGLPQIPALAQRRLFLGQEIIEFPYLDRKRREKELETILSPLGCKSQASDKSCQEETAVSYEALLRNDINYIFSPQALFWLEGNSKISTSVYKRDGIFIYKITK